MKNDSQRREAEFLMIYEQLTEDEQLRVIERMQELLAMQSEIA